MCKKEPNFWSSYHCLRAKGIIFEKTQGLPQVLPRYNQSITQVVKKNCLSQAGRVFVDSPSPTRTRTVAEPRQLWNDSVRYIRTWHSPIGPFDPACDWWQWKITASHWRILENGLSDLSEEAGEEGGGPVWDGSCDVEMPALTSPGGLIFCRLKQSWYKKNGQSQKKVEILEIIKK